MTPQQQSDKINAFIAGFDDLVNDTFTKAIYNLETDIKERIFEEHLDVNGTKLGQYSTTPILIGAKSFINKGNANTFFNAQKKKKGESKWRTIGDKHLYILEGGYKELRAIQGRPTNEINLQYTGELLLNGMQVVISPDNYQIRFKNELSKNKGRGFERKRGKKVCYASAKEQKTAVDYIGKTILREIKKAFGNV